MPDARHAHARALIVGFDEPIIEPGEQHRVSYAATSDVRSTRRTNRTGALLLASFGALLAFLDVTIVNVAFPSIRQSFPQTSLGGLSWVLNSYNIVFAALLVAAGRLADVFGRRRVFTIGVFVFTLASALCATANSVDLLIAWRVAQAVGAGLLVPSSLALVIEAFPADRRAHAVGVWGATAAFAAGIGPPLGGALVDADNWRLAFLVNVPLGAAALAATGRVLVESRSPGRRRLPDLLGATLLGGAMALLTLGIVEGPTWGWTSGGVLVAWAVAGALAAGFVVSSRRHQVPVLDPALLRVPTFAVANVVTFVAGMGFYAYMLNNILWLHYVWGWSLVRSGLAVAPGAFVAAAAAGLLGDVADRYGARVVAVPGAVVWAGAYVWYAVVVGSRPDFLGAWLPGQVLSGIGVGATLPIVASAALAAVPGARYGTASAVVSSTRQLGAVLGVALLVVIVGSPSRATAATAFRHGWLLSIGCFAIAAVVGLALRRTGATAIDEVTAPAAPLVHVADVESAVPTRAADRSAVFDHLPPATRDRLLDTAQRVTIDGGRWLFRAGDPTDALYVVSSGRLDVVGTGGVVRELSTGDVVGELGVLTGAPRSAGVRARRDSVLWRVTPEGFQQAVQRDNQALQAVTRSLAELLQDNHGGDAAPSRPPTVVAIVGVGDDAPVRHVADLVRAQLSAHLRVLSTETVTAEALHRLEPDHDRVLLVSPGANRRWQSFCLRQSDRALVVAASTSPPPESLRGRATDGYVLLVGPAPTRALLTEWYDVVSPRVVVQATDATLADDVAALSARLAGRSIAVAIAGGGARSLAAIGVLEELTARGFRLDRLAGCSVGGVVAALYASGRDAAAVDAVCYDEFVRRNPFNDYRLPTVSLVRGRKTEAAISRHLGDTVFEELPRELTLVSTDLFRRELVVHRRGPVGPAVRASLSLPGLYPPARVGDQLHVDGGVLDNLPVAPLADRDEGPVVAVNIAAAAPSANRSHRMPTLGETLLRTMLMAGSSTLDEARRRAAVVVTPDTRGIGLLEFHQIDRAREAGRLAGAAAASALEQVLAGAATVPEPLDVVVPRQRSGNGARERSPAARD